MQDGRPALLDRNGSVVALDGETLTLWGGIGSDGRMVVCGVEERGAPAE